MLISAAVLLGLLAPQETSPSGAARTWRQAHEHEIVREFTELLSMANHGRDEPNIRRNAEWIVDCLARRGIDVRLLEVAGAPPVVFGELHTPGATRTLVFYVHYDGQPVVPSEWITGDPFNPTLADAAFADGGSVIPFPEAGTAFDPQWRLYGRSTGDDKAPIIALMAGLDGLRAAGIALRANLKFFFEGEEELGSPHLAEILREHRELLAADAWIFCDGPVHQNRTQQVAFGARGVTGMELTVYGSRRELHSGHYGNWAPNPALMLAQLLASMKGPEGEVLVEGFYDDVVPLTALERAALDRAPDFGAALREELWLGRTEGRGASLDQLINRPSLNIRGLSSANVGATARNIIPSTATASIDIRLVKGMEHQTTTDRVLEHIRAQGYFITDREPGPELRFAHPRIVRVTDRGGYNAMRTPMDLPICQEIIAAIEQARGPVVRMPTLGGSLPLSVFEAVLQVPVIIVPIANHDNNQHGHNENIRLQNLWDGIETMAALMAMR